MSILWQVRVSGIWQLVSAVVSDGNERLVIDPGYFPRELVELRGMVSEPGARIQVVFTHGHWDHVSGWRSFPDSEVLMSQRLSEAIFHQTESAQKSLREAQDFDRKWYVDRGAALAWPPVERLRGLREGDSVRLGNTQVEVLQLPGHSEDGLALRFAQDGLLIVGDYLSPCEIPFVSDLTAYRATLRKLLDLLTDARWVLPGHGRPLSAMEARTIAQSDLQYLEELAACAHINDLRSALALTLPRAAEVPEMADHHRDNCRVAGLLPDRDQSAGV